MVRHNPETKGSVTYLQLFEKSMRRYMKSYFPKLDSLTIPFSSVWLSLFGMFRSITFEILVRFTRLDQKE